MDKTGLQPRIKETRWRIDLEVEILKEWEREGLYNHEIYGDPEKIIVVDTPPPYPSGRWHVGAAAHYAHIDMIVRYLRMKGFRVLAPWYADRNGLPVEILVERVRGVNPHEMAQTPEGRERFLEMCREELDKIEGELVNIWRRLGCSFEYWRSGTDSPEYRMITQTTFLDLFKRGLIYEAERPVYWCPRCRTTLAEAELEYTPQDLKLYYIKIEISDGSEKIIATTRPELLGAMVALAYNPKDERYKGLAGLKGVVPIYRYEVPIIELDDVDPSFGTGFMMISSYGDIRDVRVVRELGLKPRVIIDKNGLMNELAGPLKGLSISEARDKIVSMLREEGYIVREEVLRGRDIPVCWRCKTPIEIVHSREFFLKQLEFSKDLLKIIDMIEFYPSFHKKKLVEWIQSLRMDWPISKTRYYATEIPLWRCSSCGGYIVPEPGRYYRPWKEPPPVDRCPYCGASREKIYGENRVFDTWFDSSISALYASKWLRDRKFYEKASEFIIRPQGYDIIRTWLYYSILRIYQITGKPAFKVVRISGMGLDEKGEAMHKSKGNIIDPEPIIEKYGADAIRFWAASSAKLGYDYRYNESIIRTGSLFITKIFNIARFISFFDKPSRDEVRLREIDKALLKKLNTVIRDCENSFREYDVFNAIHSVYNFTWDIFASNYIEMIKGRAYNNDKKYSLEEQKAAWYVLHETLSIILRLLAPIMPFVTDYLWRRIYGSRSIHLERFPQPIADYDSFNEKTLDLAVELNSILWKYKKRSGMKLSQPLDRVVYISDPEAISIVEELRDLHKIKEIRIGEPENLEKFENLGRGVFIERKTI
ncbi:MAG: valine--tRNA ligase [Sulfolobales archaeon]